MSKNYVSVIGKTSNIKTNVDKDLVIEALKKVQDPEILMNIYELGFIYKIDIDEFGNVEIDMTLTAPGCPVADVLPMSAANSVSGVEGVGEVKVALVWDPPWSIDKASKDVKDLLEFF